MHRNPSSMTHTFSQVPRAEIPRSRFDRSHAHKTAFSAGLLIPIYADEALPGDTASVRLTAFARLTTPIVPFMDNLVMDVHFFACPVRLLWDNWVRMNGEQDKPGDSTDYLVPQVENYSATGFGTDSVADYLGLPPNVNPISVSALWHRMYAKTYNEWYRDESLQQPLTVPKGDGPDSDQLYPLMRRGKRKDYFTSALPWPQKGPGVAIPLGLKAPVKGIGFEASGGGAGNVVPPGTSFWEGGEGYRPYAAAAWINVTAGQRTAMELEPPNGTNPAIYADLSEASAATINSLRQAFQIQRIYERDARGGTRYPEMLKAHFGVTNPDSRMQRVEFLGGGSVPVTISPIPQTSGTPGAGGYTSTPQGNLAAMGTVLARGIGFTTSFTEHCVLLGIASVRADLTYQQGINRMFSRRTRFDFYLPALAGIGEQAILSKEIYADGTAADGEVFGYIPRYDEYRYKPSIITGKLRSVDPQSLDVWHLAQDFGARPLLNSSFIQEIPPLDRVVAVPSEPHFVFDGFFSMKWARPMPVFGVPGLIDHF